MATQDSGHDPELTYASSASPSWSSFGLWDFSPPQNHRPEQISPVSSLSISQYQAKRARRTHGSSSGSGEPEDDGFLSKNFRVGGPYLCPYPAVFLPVQTTYPQLESLRIEHLGIYTSASQILRDHGISPETIDFNELQSIDRPLPRPVVTLVVTAERKKLDGSWISAARLIHQLLRDKDLGDISVEITDPRAFRRKTCSPVRPSDDIFAAWESVYEAILKTVDKHELTALECFRYGRNEDTANNPPTVILSVIQDSQTDWELVREQVVNLLDGMGFSHVAVCIMEDQITRSVDSKGLLPDTGCQVTAQAGLSIGMEQRSTGTGTLGGFLEIKLPGSDEWQKKGITCFHCVYDGRIGNSAKETECKSNPVYIFDIQLIIFITPGLDHWKWNHVAASDNDAASLLKMWQPSWQDIKMRIAQIDNELIDDLETSEFQQMEQDIENGEFILPFLLREHRAKKTLVDQKKELKANLEDFLGSGKTHLGHVFAGSGMNSVKSSAATDSSERPSIRDWALIDVKSERMGDNKASSLPAPFIPDGRMLTFGRLISTQIPRPVFSARHTRLCMAMTCRLVGISTRSEEPPSTPVDRMEV